MFFKRKRYTNIYCFRLERELALVSRCAGESADLGLNAGSPESVSQ